MIEVGHHGQIGHWAVSDVAPAQSDVVASEIDRLAVLIQTGNDQQRVRIMGNVIRNWGTPSS